MGKKSGWEIYHKTKNDITRDKYEDLAGAAGMAKHRSIFAAGQWEVYDLDKEADAGPVVVYRRGKEV